MGGFRLKGQHKKALKRISNSDLKAKGSKVVAVQIVGSGAISSKETEVLGTKTLFLEEAERGDKISVVSPISGNVEERVVAAIKNGKLLTLAAPFSSDLTGSTTFEIVKSAAASREIGIEGIKFEDGESLKVEVARRLVEKGEATTISYRERTGAGYKQQQKILRKNVTAEQRLDERIRLSGRDKFC